MARQYVKYVKGGGKTPYRFRSGKFGKVHPSNTLGPFDNKKAKAKPGKWIPT